MDLRQDKFVCSQVGGVVEVVVFVQSGVLKLEWKGHTTIITCLCRRPRFCPGAADFALPPLTLPEARIGDSTIYGPAIR